MLSSWNLKGGWLVVAILKWKTWLWHESGFWKSVCKYTEHCKVSCSRKADEKHHAWLNLFLNLLTFVSHAWIACLWNMAWNAGTVTMTCTHKHQILKTLRVFWGHGLLVYCKKEGKRVINPETRERCVGETSNKNETENEGQISLFSGATHTVSGKDKRAY